jgi:hypothetical protein
MGQDDGHPETKNVGGMLALSQEYPRWTPCTENREQGTCLTGEPATLKGVRLVRRGTDEKGQQCTSSAVYPLP